VNNRIKDALRTYTSSYESGKTVWYHFYYA